MLSFYNFPDSLCLVLNCDDLELEEFCNMRFMSTERRRESYSIGGVKICTAQTLITDILNTIIDYRKISSIFIPHAHRLKRDSIIHFILSFIKYKSQGTVIKAFSDDPISIATKNFFLTDFLEILRINNVLLYPRFHEEIKNELDNLHSQSKKNTNENGQNSATNSSNIDENIIFNEIQIKMVGWMEDLQLYLLDLIQGMKNEIDKLSQKRLVFSDYYTTVIHKQEDHNSKDRVQQQLKPTTLNNLKNTLHRDLKDLEYCLELLFSLDLVEFTFFYSKLYNSEEDKKGRTWILNTSSHLIFEIITQLSHKSKQLRNITNVEDCVEILNPQLNRISPNQDLTTGSNPLNTYESQNMDYDAGDSNQNIPEKKKQNLNNESCSFKERANRKHPQTEKDKNHITIDLNSERRSYSGNIAQMNKDTQDIDISEKNLKKSSGEEAHNPQEIANTLKTKSKESMGESQDGPINKKKDFYNKKHDYKDPFVSRKLLELNKIIKDHKDKAILILSKNLFHLNEIEKLRYKNEQKLYFETHETFKSTNCRIVILLDFSLSTIRKLEQPDTSFEIFLLFYKNSKEEEFYIARLRDEKEAFERFINEKANMPLTNFEHFLPTDESSSDEMYQADKRLCKREFRTNNYSFSPSSYESNREQYIIDHEGDLEHYQENTSLTVEIQTMSSLAGNSYRVIVDFRELRSSLPFYLHKYHNNLEIACLAEGDYLFSNFIVERKTIYDLIGSFNNGRLLSQMTRMFSHHRNYYLLLEYENKPSLFSYCNNSESLKSNLIAKFCLLSIHFPKLRFIHTTSDILTAKSLRILQQKNMSKEYTSHLQIDPRLLEILLAIPTMNSFMIKTLQQNFKNLKGLLGAKLEKLCDLFGSHRGNIIYKFFHKR